VIGKTLEERSTGMIKLRLFSALREIAGAKEVEVEGDQLSIKEALEKFAGKHGDKARETLFDMQGDLLPSVLLLVNGEAAENGGATRVAPGDTVQVLLPTAGG
jgi:MoaD family protein